MFWHDKHNEDEDHHEPDTSVPDSLGSSAVNDEKSGNLISDDLIIKYLQHPF